MPSEGGPNCPRGPRWNDITAVFGGTFDPPHLGHFEAVRGLFQNPGIKQALILPTAAPPHKPCRATREQRLALTQLAFTPELFRNLNVKIDDRELSLARTASGRPSYTFDTLIELRREYSQLAFVIGSDQLEKLSSWHRFPDVLSLANWLVLERKPGGSRQTGEGLQILESGGLIRQAPLSRSKSEGNWLISNGNTYLKVVPTDAADISSTQIRETIARTGEPDSRLLQSKVLSYLKLHRIYGTSAP